MADRDDTSETQPTRNQDLPTVPAGTSTNLEQASSMFDTARAIVESSLSPNLGRRERRLAYARRMYGDELPEAALIAFADWPEDR
jgi:hypothetical protein